MKTKLIRNMTVLVVFAALAALVAGCGSDNKTSSDTTSSVETLSTTGDEAKLAEATVAGYYSAISDKNLKDAWTKLSKKARDKFKGYENWALRKRGIKSIDVADTKVKSITSNQATVDVTYKLTGIDACKDKINQTFSGTWTLNHVGGDWVGDVLKIKQTGGGKPQTNPSKCPGAKSSASGTSTTAGGKKSGGSSGGSGEGDEYYEDDCEYYGDCYDDYGDYEDDESYPEEDTPPPPPIEQDDGSNTNAQNFQP